jgi:dienelactone hydrolase
MLRRVVAVAGILAAVVAPGAAARHPFPHFGAGCARADFRSGGDVVRAERCGPASGARAVVVLHGCGGFDTFDHRLADGLPRFGISTLYVDYFAPTPPPGNKGFCNGAGRGEDPFPTWERVVADAAATLRHRYTHAGVVGWSLGGGLALAVAENGHPFDAAAVFSSFAGGRLLGDIDRLPPTIFLSGGKHDVVPVADAVALDRAARATGVHSALYVYPDGNHSWKGAQGVAGRARAAAFLRRWLR